jgi:hypothetical protein
MRMCCSCVVPIIRANAQLCQSSEGVFTEFGVRSILLLQESDSLGGGGGASADRLLPPPVRSLREIARSLARIQDQRMKAGSVYESFLQMQTLLLTSGATFTYDESQADLVHTHHYPHGYKAFEYGGSLAVLQAIQRTLLNVWEVRVRRASQQPV